MIDISLKHIKKSYGADLVLQDVSIEIHSKDRIGLIGQNGSGKTTTLKIIAGREEYDEGSLFIDKDKKIGYLDQIPEFPDTYTVLDVLNGAFSPLTKLKRKMKALEQAFAEKGEPGDSVFEKKYMDEYGKLQTEFEQKGGYESETNLEKICTGLKLSSDFQTRRFSRLSSGEKSIVVLGKILLESCDIMLLDEPTNHLDFEAIEWLETFLVEYPGDVVIISHDRYFLDKSVNKIVELEGGRTEVYHGHYSYYVEEKDRRLFAQFEQHKNQEKKIKAMEAAIRRFREWGRRSDDPRMFRKAANMEKRIERMEKIDKPVLERRKIKLDPSKSRRSGKDVVEIRNLTKRFGDSALLEDLNGLVRYQERVAILGRNGSGKSTILKLILGQMSPEKGEIRIGSQVKVGYLEQEVSFPDQERSILDELRYVLGIDQGKARALLSKVLFYREDAFKKIASLSGGERVRLKWCLLMHQDINFLVLDEPTNHLDINSREVLEEYLMEFTGTILFISHDRFFINKMAHRILHLDSHRLANYPGNYDDFKEMQSEPSPAIRIEAGHKDKLKKKAGENRFREQKKGSENRKKKIEAEMEDIEDRIRRLESDMEQHPTDFERQQALYTDGEELKRKLEILFNELIEIE